MARDHLSDRPNWQGTSAARGHGAEDAFTVIMQMHLRGSSIEAVYKPNDLAGIYGQRRGPDDRMRPHGVRPEFAVRNRETDRAVYVEIKRQRASGNAHERACKYLMPGIVASAQPIANQPAGVLPFWLIFTNGIATNPNYRQEIMHWFRGIERHVLLWENVRDVAAVTDHFDQHIRPLLG